MEWQERYKKFNDRENMTENKIKLLNPADALVINATALAWFSLSQTMRAFDQTRYADLRTEGEKEFARLKAIAATGDITALKIAILHYEWEKDKIDYVPEPWVVCALKTDDCDGSAWLLAALIPGTIYCIVRVEKGKIKDYKSWHFFFRDKNGYVWSNYRLDGKADPLKWAKDYDRKATHVVQIDPGFRVVNIKPL